MIKYLLIKKKEFFPVLIHEIAHIYSRNCLNFFGFPTWLNEGLSYVVANQDKNNNVKNLDRVLECYNYKEWMENPAYSASGKFVRYLVDNYGKDKLLRLMKKLDYSVEKQEFENKFKKMYNKEVVDIFNEFKRSLD